MPFALVRLVPLALRDFVAFAGDGVLRLVHHGLGNAGTLLTVGLSHVATWERVMGAPAHGRAETLVVLNEIGVPVVGDHGNGPLRILRVERSRDEQRQR